MILKINEDIPSSGHLHFLILAKYCPVLAQTLLDNFPFLSTSVLYFSPKVEDVSWALENNLFDYIYILDRNLTFLYPYIEKTRIK